MIQTTLVDARNIDMLEGYIANHISSAKYIGLDCETEDSDRHEGLNLYCKYDDEGYKGAGGPLVFDMRRTVMCGLSIYTETMDSALYFNLGHADEENRLPWKRVKALLDLKSKDGIWIAHNAPFELTAFRSCYDYYLSEILCTLQMCVSAYGPHEYSHDAWIGAGRGGMGKLVPWLMEQAHQFDKATGEMEPELAETVFKIISKTSDAEHSYNGLVKSIAYGYGLKRAVATHFNHAMTTYEECLGDKAHMGQLTGEEVAAYGAEDAYWALRLFRHLVQYMVQNGGKELIDTFLHQENPMIHLYSDIWTYGMKVNMQAIAQRRDLEREMMAQLLRDMKKPVRNLLPFSVSPNEKLSETEKWYRTNWQKYRNLIESWATSPDNDNAFEQCYQVRGAVSGAWAAELGKAESIGPNLSHYMPQRVVLYDLIGAKPIMSGGKVQSDGAARGKVRDKTQGDGVEVIDSLNKMAGIDQRMKLYLTPYTRLMDPETGRLYPVVTSMLATRRMAASYPNPMQLSKRGDSTYVRGFFQADSEDHLVVSLDWSAIELVEIGEFSGDPEFIKAFSQIPHEDLHSGAAADILSVEVEGLDEKSFKALKGIQKWEEWIDVYATKTRNFERLQTNLKGEQLDPSKAYGYWRTEIGKGANFNYWYSGWLGTVGERMGWDGDTTKRAVDRYRERFIVAEGWRTDLIKEVSEHGFVTLPDGHRYVRYESTDRWLREFLTKFQFRDQPALEAYNDLIYFIARKIQKRGYNQTVNALIQGSCGTIAKRSALRIKEYCKQQGWDARLMVPIHDELVFSVHHSIVPDLVFEARRIMTDHPDIFTQCKLDATPAVGVTFEPWHPSKAPKGQIELFEPPKDIVGEALAGRRLDKAGIQSVVDYLRGT